MYACSECNNQNTLICNKCTGYINESTKPSRFEAGKQIPINVKFAEHDLINHPPHYTYGKIEVIDFIEDKKLNFSRGSAVKYICRAGKKENELQDLEKAEWFIKREIERVRAQ